MSLKKIGNKVAKKVDVPAYDDPQDEIRRLIQEHVALTRASVAFTSSASDKVRQADLVKDGEVIAKKGDTIACRLPVDTQLAIQAFAKDKLKKDAARLEKAIKRELRKVPLYTEFLSKVQGCGTIVAGYIVAMVDFSRCEKPSALKRYCGFAVFDGKREQPTKGQALHYNKEMKTRLYQLFSMGIRMAGSRSKSESKYMTIWAEKKATLLAIRGPGTSDNKSKGWCDDTARRKATDVFLEDLYIVGRTLAGLPVWPSWYAKAMGYEHGGKVAVLAPKMLTLEEALRVVGVGGEAAKDDDIEALDEAYSELADVAAE